MRQNRYWKVTLLPSLLLTGTVVLLRAFGVLQVIEWKTLDLALRWRPAEVSDPRIAIITIADADIQSGLAHPPSDLALADLIGTLQKHEPRVIGIDILRDRPVREGEAILRETLQAKNVVVVNTILGNNSVDALPFLPEEQIGFADAPVDQDGFMRRSYLAAADSEGVYRFSLALRLVMQYLESEGILIGNGLRDQQTIRFGKTEIPRFQPNTGGYVRTDNGGNQSLINFRAGEHPFETFSYQDVMSGEIRPEQLHDRVILVGYTAQSVKDFVSSGAIAGVNPSLVPGITMHAHIVSQILNAVYADRPFLRTLPNALEYLFVMGGGGLGLLLLSRKLKSLHHIFAVVVIGIAGGLAYYGLIVIGWWLPLIPVMASFSLTAIALPVYQPLSSQREEREALIDALYTSIHNGPLQRVATILSGWPENQPLPSEMREEVESLNRELRATREDMRQEILSLDEQLVVANHTTIDLDIPLHEMLYEAYQATLSRHRDFFSAVIQLTTFEPMDNASLSPVQKRKLGRFLEEMLNNVVRHAPTTTRLKTICQGEGDRNIIRIIDNARPAAETQTSTSVSNNRCSTASNDQPGGDNAQEVSSHIGYGTSCAEQLAHSLGGQFSRTAIQPHGTCCELWWPI